MESLQGTWQKPARKRIWDTQSVAKTERFAYYREAICQAFMDLVPEPPRRGSDHFFAEVQSVPLGVGAINRVYSASHRVTRTRKEITSSNSACYYLNLKCKGACTIIQSGSEVAISPSQVGIFASDQPFELEHERLHELQVASFWVPKEALADRLPGGMPAVPRRPSDDPIVGRLVVQTARTLNENADLLAPQDGARLFDMLLDLVAMALSGSGRARVDGREAMRAGLAVAIRRTVAELAHDPSLSVSRVAAMHGVTKRYVHKVFERETNSFGEYLMAYRLDGAARELCDSRKANTSVCAIALEWGFKDHSHFSKRFKERFMVTPSEWRQMNG